jgi:hypothetical protein
MKFNSAREIEPTDNAIDRLASPAETSCELSRKGIIYGLCEEEAEVIEGK